LIEFILLGFTTDPMMQLVLFFLFLGMCSVTFLGNTTLLVLICSDSQLYTPMYFFIRNRCLQDIWLFSDYTPKILMTCISENKAIIFDGCAAQSFFFSGLGNTESYLLAAMASDCYVAISKPLLYSQAMLGRLCFCLVLYSYTGGFVNSTILTSNTFTLEFCFAMPLVTFSVISYPFMMPHEVGMLCEGKLSVYVLLHPDAQCFCSIVLILASYLFIIASILRMLSTQECLKAFCTCSSHQISVTLYFGSVL
jgi:olfactory receptor